MKDIRTKNNFTKKKKNTIVFQTLHTRFYNARGDINCALFETSKSFSAFRLDFRTKQQKGRRTTATGPNTKRFDFVRPTVRNRFVFFFFLFRNYDFRSTFPLRSPSEFHLVESVPPKLVFRRRDPPSAVGLLLLGCLLGGEAERSEDTPSACLSTRSASNASSRLDALIFSRRTGVGTK